jgi:Fe-S cluster assembly iron-binding protein IscA
LALDEPRDNDKVIEQNDITYVINEQLFDDIQPISVDFIESAMGSGFSVTSKMSKADGCGSSCSSSCAC